MINEFAIFGIQWLLWLLITIIFFIGLYSESEQDGKPAFGAFVVFVILYAIWGSVSLTDTFKLKYIAHYLGTGIIFSIIKTFFWQLNENKNTRAKEHVLRWILNWPMSLVFLLIEDLGSVFKKFTGSFYDMIENFGKTFQKQKDESNNN